MSYDLVGKLKRNNIWGKKWICLALFVLGSVYFIIKVYQIAFEVPVDFKYIWLAGDIWSQHASPYTSFFAELGQRYFEGGSIPKYWFYPPNWYLFSIAIGTLSFPVAVMIWLGLNCLFFGSMAFFLVKAMQKDQHRFDYITFFGAFGFLALLQATPMTMSLGQTALLIGFGASLVFFGVSRHYKSLVCFGLVILMLKPQFGLVFSLYLFLNREYRITVLAAAAIVVASIIPALVTGGAIETVSGLLSNLSSYRYIEPNLPQNMTGLRSLIYLVIRKEISPILMLGVALGIAAMLAWFLNSRETIWHTETERIKTGLLIITAIVLVIIPLHTYDFVLIAPFVALIIARRHLNITMIAGLALVFRSGNLAEATGLYDPSNSIFPGSLLSTIGACLILADLLWRHKRLPV